MSPIVLTDLGIVLLILTSLRLLGGSRLMACIWVVALQGLVLGLLPLVADSEMPAVHTLALSVVSIGVKALLLPLLLRRAVREAQVRREIQPIVNQSLSLLFGLAALGFSGWMASRLTLPAGSSPLGAPAAFFLLLVGLFLIVARRQALTQVLGYLVLENGVFLFGVLFVRTTPWLVELGVLLDVFVSVFVMGITIFHINRAFDAIDSDRLSELHDLVMEQGPEGEPRP